MKREGFKMAKNSVDSVKVLGKEYLKLYDENGDLQEKCDKYGIDIEESIEELKSYGLVETVKVKGIKYYRALPPKS